MYPEHSKSQALWFCLSEGHHSLVPQEWCAGGASLSNAEDEAGLRENVGCSGRCSTSPCRLSPVWPLSWRGCGRRLMKSPFIPTNMKMLSYSRWVSQTHWKPAAECISKIWAFPPRGTWKRKETGVPGTRNAVVLQSWVCRRQWSTILPHWDMPTASTYWLARKPRFISIVRPWIESSQRWSIV